MRILFATGIFPPDIGGPATMLSHLAQDLTVRGFEIKIVTYVQEYENIKIQEYKNLDVYRINRNNKLKYFWQMWKLAKWADLIYATDTYSVGYFAYLIKKLTGRKYILRFTGDSAWETARANGWTEDYIVDFNIGNTGECHPEEPRARDDEGSRKIYNKINKLKVRRNKILFNADKIIVDCEFNKNLATLILEQYGSSQETGANDMVIKKITVIPNAVDFGGDNVGTDRDLSEKIKQKFSPNGEKIILTACRLTPWKGVDKILEILPELIRCLQSPDWRQDVHSGSNHEIGANDTGGVNLLVLGDGSELEKLKVLSRKLSVESCVHFLGKIPHTETYNYFKAANVFVLNSQYEGTSHALLDAMSAGVPVLASNVGGNPELIENGVNGFLFEYNNKKEMVSNLEKVLTAPVVCHSHEKGLPAGEAGNPENGAHENLSEFLSANAREKLKKFSWEGVVEKTEEVIKSIK